MMAKTRPSGSVVAYGPSHNVPAALANTFAALNAENCLVGLDTEAIAKRLAEIDNTLLAHDAALRDLYQRIRPLLLPPPDPPRRKIGFKTDN